jgi:hypothetical protein
MAKAKKLDLFTRQLNSAEFDTLVKCKRDPFLFAQFIMVVHPLLGKVNFNLYPYQKSVLFQFLKERFNIILKFRQAGITELISMYCLWLAMYHPHKNIVIISIKDRVAKKVLRKIKFMYNNLPDYLKTPVVNGKGDEIGTATEMEFANGSIITSIPTTEEAGRSEAVSLLIIDEAAVVRWISKIWAAAFPTLSTGGAAIVNSTPYGMGNWYHNTWVEACAGGSNFNPIRLNWQMHPERDMDWYNAMRMELGPRKTAQEIDGDFLQSGNTVFDMDDIRGIEDLILGDPEYRPIKTYKPKQGTGNIRIYRYPKPNEKCFVGADISTGRGNDYSAFSIMNSGGEELASYKGKIGLFPFAYLLGEMGKTFNDATLGPEGVGLGEGVVAKLQEEGYKNLYYSTQLVKEKGQKKAKEKTVPGFYTSSATRPVLITELEEDISTDSIQIKDPDFVREAYTFIYDANNKPVALGRSSLKDSEDELDSVVFNDDSIMAKGITNRIRKSRQKSPLILPI